MKKNVGSSSLLLRLKRVPFKMYIIYYACVKEEEDEISVVKVENPGGGLEAPAELPAAAEDPRPRRYGLRQKRVQKYSKFGEEFFSETQETELQVKKIRNIIYR